MLCRSMKTDPKRRRIPIIALMPRSEDEIKYAWADSRLAEPIDTAVLVDCIKQHLAAAPRA
jgi:CheY-like chemotaxis protein